MEQPLPLVCSGAGARTPGEMVEYSTAATTFPFALASCAGLGMRGPGWVGGSGGGGGGGNVTSGGVSARMGPWGGRAGGRAARCR